MQATTTESVHERAHRLGYTVARTSAHPGHDQYTIYRGPIRIATRYGLAAVAAYIDKLEKEPAV